ncbi:MAG: general secretion pathway protein GspB [Phycisphaerales bacterium]|nr:general secretion pathway protein GspB [Phycisphaerales bacterium]
MPDSLKDVLTKFKSQLVADKKKSAALGLLLIVFLVVVGRALFSGSTPEPAQAVSVPVAKTGSPKPDSKTVAKKAESGDTGQKRSPQISSRESSLSPKKSISVKDMPRVLARDIFSTPSWNRFKLDIPDVPKGTGDQEPQNGPSWFTQFGWKLSEYKRTRSATKAQIASELDGLELQSTMTGSSRSAYISGRLVREGDTIRGFSVVHIDDRSVTLRKSGIEETLTMP